MTDVTAVSTLSRKGDCWDNAVAESFFGTLKAEISTPSNSNYVPVPFSNWHSQNAQTEAGEPQRGHLVIRANTTVKCEPSGVLGNTFTLQ